MLKLNLAKVNLKSEFKFDRFSQIPTLARRCIKSNFRRKLVAISPKSFKACFYLANTLFTLGQIDEAIGEYSKVLDIDRNSIYAHTNLGLAYYQKQNYLKAREEFETILKLDPQNQLAKERLNLLQMK